MGTDGQRPHDESGPGGDDLPPSGEEARAQQKATTMPLIWLVLGAAVVAVFLILLATRSPLQPSPNALPTKAPPAPTTGPPSRGDVQTIGRPPAPRESEDLKTH